LCKHFGIGENCFKGRIMETGYTTLAMIVLFYKALIVTVDYGRELVTKPQCCATTAFSFLRHERQDNVVFRYRTT